MTFQLLDQVLVTDPDSEHFACMGRVYAISARDGVLKYDVELARPRPAGFTWFTERQLEEHRQLLHADLLEKRNGPGDKDMSARIRAGFAARQQMTLSILIGPQP